MPPAKIVLRATNISMEFCFVSSTDIRRCFKLREVQIPSVYSCLGQGDNVSDENEQNPFDPLVQDAEMVSPPQGASDGTGGVIPYKNPSALVAYYLGIFSFIPVIGLFLAVPAFILGVLGLIARKRNPAVRGSVHAWIGIVLGGIFSLVWGCLVLFIALSMFVG